MVEGSSVQIRIDKGSIRKNPNAGRTVYYREVGPPQSYEKIIDGDVVIEKYNGRECIRRTKLDNDVYELSSWMPFEIQYSLTPEPDYFFEYLSTDVSCEACGRKFDYSLLEDDWPNDECRVINICPFCKEPNCCEIEYEQLDSSFSL